MKISSPYAPIAIVQKGQKLLIGKFTEELFMPWVESHSVLIRHRKLKDFARELSVKPVTALGHLHCLWHTAIEQAEDGDLSKWTEGAIADAAQWEGIPKDFLKASFSSGFLDKGQLLHDWLDYAGRYLTSKYKTSNTARLHEIWAKYGKKYGKEFLNTSFRQPLGDPPTLPNLDNQPTNQIKSAARFTPPSLAQVSEYIAAKGFRVDAVLWMAHYESNGWMVGKNKMRKWKAAIVTWEKNKNFDRPKQKTGMEALRA